MKGIVEVNGQHLMAPSVEVAAKIVTLIGKCRPMVESYVQRRAKRSGGQGALKFARAVARRFRFSKWLGHV